MCPLDDRHQDGNRSVHAGGEVDHRYADTHRRALRLAIDAHQPSHALDDRVVAGIAAERTVGAEAGDAAMDEAWEAGLEHRLVPHVPFLQRAGLEVFNQNVGGLEQAEKNLAPLRLGEIEHDAALVAIDADEIGGGITLEGWPPAARLIALRRLDLDDFGTVVAEHLRAVRPAEHAREIDHLDAGEGADACCGHVFPIQRGVY